MHDVAEGPGLREKTEDGEGVQRAADLKVGLDQEVECDGGAGGAAEAAGLSDGAKGVHREDAGVGGKGLEEGRRGPVEAGAEEGVGEEGEREGGVGEAVVEAEEIEEAKSEARIVVALMVKDEEKALDVAGAEAVGDEGGGEGGAPALRAGTEDVAQDLDEALVAFVVVRGRRVGRPDGDPGGVRSGEEEASGVEERRTTTPIHRSTKTEPDASVSHSGDLTY